MVSPFGKYTGICCQSHLYPYYFTKQHKKPMFFAKFIKFFYFFALLQLFYGNIVFVMETICKNFPYPAHPRRSAAFSDMSTKTLKGSVL